VYGMVRLAYAEFYSAFGLTPEDVGLGYQETIAQAGLALILLALVATFAVTAAILLYATGAFLYVSFAFRLLGRIRGTPEQRRARRYQFHLEMEKASGFRGQFLKPFAAYADPSRSVSSDLRGISAFATGAGIVVATFGVGVYLWGTAHSAAQRVRDGEAVTQPELFGLPFLHIGAEPVVIEELRSSPKKPLRTEPCALYLGQASGTTFLFFPARATLPAETLRVPSNQLAVWSPRPSRCPPSR
jgi:hypothetical protein